ncbi:MAG TPA: hypothetical protein VFS43_22930 [Polyangiaceae bacterium]|nr:hypothetical protein [Polyangiaceae bacterium]
MSDVRDGAALARLRVTLRKLLEGADANAAVGRDGPGFDELRAGLRAALDGGAPAALADRLPSEGELAATHGAGGVLVLTPAAWAYVPLAEGDLEPEGAGA